jgi:Flp pilus assembly pilin Flp
MDRPKKWLWALYSDRRGITALEYGIIASWLAFVVIAAFTHMGTSLSTIFLEVSSGL